MESATIITPLAPALVIFCSPVEPNIPEGPEYEDDIKTLLIHGEMFYQLYT